MTTRTTRTSTRTTPTRTRTTPTPKSGRALARAVEPLTANEFLSEHWERKPFLASRREPGRFDDLLSEADVERLVCSTGIRYPAFRLVKEGAKIDVADYTEDVSWRPRPFTGAANVERVLGQFEAGATIVLQGLHLHWRPLAEFSRELEAALGHPVQANAYYTPRSAQGLPVHHDTHDVFSLQVAGEKRWLVYEPALELPLRDQRYRPELGGPGDPVHDVTLGPGDTLYLPRGWLHEATTSATDSLHITIGINVYTWFDAFRAALEECAAEVEFRHAVPDGGDGRPEDLLEQLRGRLAPEDVERRRRERFVKARRPILGGQLRQLRALDGLTTDTLVERRPTVIADVATENGRVMLSFEGKEVVFPAQARAGVEHAAKAPEPFRPRDLPGDLDEAGRLVLVRRLVREGFLRLTEVEPPGNRSRRDGGAAEE
jgi:ribosomal protein L16 Arg81 hydroxylase